MLSTVVLGALALVPGVPLALVVGRGGRRRWSGVVVEALLLGIAWYVLLGLFLSHAGWYGQWQVLAPTVLASLALAIRARRELPSIERPVATWFSALLGATIVAAAALRAEPFYFLYQIGDFGEYVNRANAVADGGGFIGWFTRGFTVALSLAHLALGEASTVDLMPFLGTVLLVSTVALAERLGASQWALAVVAVIMAVGAVPVWFSRFPASETLYAVLQVAMVLFVVTAVQRASLHLAVTAGVVCGLLLIVRGNGLLLGPIVVVALFVCALAVGRRTMTVLCTFAGSALLSLGAAFVFNARFSHPYFIAEQLPKFVPDPIFRHLEGMGGLRFALPRLALLVVVTGAVVWLARRLHDHVASGGALARLRPVALPAIVAVGLAVLVAVMSHEGLTDALARYDPSVEVLAMVGVGVALWRFADRMPDAERVGVALVVLVGGAFALLYAERLPTPRYAPYHLYWDRYLFSELFPVMVVSVVWAVWLLERGLRRIGVPVAVLAVPIVALGITLHRDGAVAREHTFMDDAYEQLAAVDRLAADDSIPLLFFGVPPDAMPPAVYHPNTHRIVASPLAATFGRRFLNLGLHPYAPDPLPGSIQPAAVLDHRGIPEAYVIQVAVGDDPPEPLTVTYATLEPLGDTRIDIPLLDRPLDRAQPRWRLARFTVLVSRVMRG